MIAVQGSRDAGEEINEDIEKDLDKMRVEIEKIGSTGSHDIQLESKSTWDVVKKYLDRRDFDFSDAVKTASSELIISEAEILTRISEPEGAPEIIKQLKQEWRKGSGQTKRRWIGSNLRNLIYKSDSFELFKTNIKGNGQSY